MIIGHIGAALATRRLWPRVSPALLLVATFLPDLLRVAMRPFGFNSVQSNPFTHAFPGCVFLAGAAALVVWLATRSRDATLAVPVLVLSHVVLDVVSGNKLLWRGGPRGWNLDEVYWQYELILEIGLVVLGWLVMRPVVSGVWRRAWPIAALAVLELSALSYGIATRPFFHRCLSEPFQACGDGSWLRKRWKIRVPFAQD